MQKKTFANRKLVSEKIFANDKSLSLICFLRKLKGELENVREWPAKHENLECFLSNEFLVTQYNS